MSGGRGRGSSERGGGVSGGRGGGRGGSGPEGAGGRGRPESAPSYGGRGGGRGGGGAPSAPQPKLGTGKALVRVALKKATDLPYCPAVPSARMASMGVTAAPSTSGAVVPSMTRGTRGLKKTLVTNYFPIRCPEGPFHQYRVDFSPEIDEQFRSLRGALLNKHAKEGGIFHGAAYAFDGMNLLFTQTPIATGKEVTIKSVDERTRTQYEITLTKTAIITSREVNAPLLQLFNIIFRRAMRRLPFTMFNRKLFNVENKIELVGHPLSMIPGICTSIYKTQRGLALNADVMFRVMNEKNCHELIEECRAYARSDADFKTKVKNKLRRTIALANYGDTKRTFFIDDIDFTKTPRSTFEKNGEVITFDGYFKSRYNITIKNKDQPLLVCRRKNGKEDLYVPELCNVTGITDEMRSKTFLMRQMREVTGADPNDRAQEIYKFLQTANANADFAAELRQWNFAVDPQLTTVDGRTLPAEQVLFDGSNTNGATGEWSMQGRKFARLPAISAGVFAGTAGAPVKWALVCPKEWRGIDDLLDNFFEVAKQQNIKFVEPAIYDPRPNKSEYCGAISEACKALGPQSAILIVIPISVVETDGFYNSVKEAMVYTNIKTIACQCIRQRNAESAPSKLKSILAKVIVQMVSKMGGAPWTIGMERTSPFVTSPTMCVGVDVYHSGEVRDATRASVVGFTATMNQSYTSFYSRAAFQPPRQEIITVMRPLFADALEAFKNANNKTTPKRIIVFRDGVGEGQEDEVRTKEVQAIQTLLREKSIAAKLVYVIVLKRIRTRMFEQKDTKMVNPPPGTVMDGDLTDQETPEFFLVPQKVNEGTATPTCFRVLCNEDPTLVTMDELQRFAFQLCHLYFNWFGTIRVPAPCQYAHKIADFVGAKLNKEARPEHHGKLWYI